MRTSWKLSALVVVLCVGILATGCIGPFNLTKTLHHWNSTFTGNEWGQEGMFLVLNILPVYGICILGDAIIFNSIEFWGGDNPISPPTAMVGSEGELEQAACVLGLPYQLNVVTPGY
jgi:hypothetical protein